MQKLPNDQYDISYTLLAGVGFLWWVVGPYLDRVFHPYFRLVLVEAIPIFFGILILATAFAVKAVERKWKCAASVVMAPVIAGALFYLLGFLGVTTELVRLEILKHEYERQIAEDESRKAPNHV